MRVHAYRFDLRGISGRGVRVRRYTYDPLARRGQPGVSVLRAQDHIFDVEVVALSIACLGKGRIDAFWRVVLAGSVDMYLETRTGCRGEGHLSEM